MKNKLFWKLGIIYLLMLLLVIGALGLYVVRALRQESLDTAYTQLESLSRVALAWLPPSSDTPAVQQWADILAQSGVRITLISSDGIVLADTKEDPAKMENHASRPEIREAFLNGSGRAERYSATLGRNLVYLAKRYDYDSEKSLVVRFSVPLYHLDETLRTFRDRLGIISLFIMILAGGASLLYFRTISGRIKSLKEFSHRVAEGDFRPLPRDRHGDELSDLSASLNRTAKELDVTIRTLTEERNQSAAVLAGMEEGVAVVGRDQCIIYCNRAFCKAMDAADNGWSGRPVMELVRYPDLIAFIKKVLTVDGAIRSEVVVGSVKTRSFAVTAAPVRSEGSTTGAVLVLHDISEIRRLERARRDFIANISHEFKTPLTAIQGFAETLLGGAMEDTKNRKRFLEIIRDHALRLSRLTEDLLKLAQIEAGQLPCDARCISVAEIVNPCLDTARVRAERKNLVMKADFPDDLPLLFGDLHSYQEILENLLDNAVRYTSDGGVVKVRAAVRGNEIVLSVSDNGIGIPKVEQDRIFERFYRADAARSRESGGTGLGLSIVKHLVEAQGGRITVESEVGSGSTFNVILPIRKENSPLF
ncbi:MAG: PAS domain-containing protein [Acidobacteria bacterium]|nr:PAS domain-containing protein [Acidobacteriota bacterium]